MQKRLCIGISERKKHWKRCPSEHYRLLFALQNKKCAFQDVNIQKNKTKKNTAWLLKHLSRDVTRASLCYVSLKFFAPPPKPGASSSSSSVSTNFIRISVVRFTKRGVRGHRKQRAVRSSAFFLVVQSQCDLGHIKQRKDVKKKAMWNVQCIEVRRETFMTSPPVSPVRWLENKRKSVIGCSF